MAVLQTIINNLTNAKESLETNLDALKEANSNLVNSQNEANTSVQNGKENIKKMEMELSILKEINESVSKELCNLQNSLSSKEQLNMKLINEKKENETAIIEKQNIIEKMEEKMKIAETNEKKSLNQLSKFQFQIDLLKEEIKLNNSCLKNIETLRANLEIAWRELTTEKAKSGKFEMQNIDNNKIIEQCKNDLIIYKEKVIILEKKIENLQAIGKLQTNENGQTNSLGLVRIKEMLAEERVKVQNNCDENNDLSSKLEEMEGHVKALESKFKDTKNFDDDTIQNLKEKIKIKDETIKLLTEKVEKYWPQRVENLNHIVSVKRERIASKSSSDVEELVEPSSSSVPSSCASNSSNLNNFFELNEKLAENEDFIKSLKTILKDKEEEIAKLKKVHIFLTMSGFDYY